MKSTHARNWLGAAFMFVSACSGDDLSLGDLRCTGKGVECKRVADTPLLVSGSPERESVPTREATLLWQAALPCPRAMGCYWPGGGSAGSRLLVHRDGSVTALRMIMVYERIDGDAAPRTRGLMLTRFDARGNMLWENDAMVEDYEPDSNAPSVVITAALALDAADEALLAVNREESTWKQTLDPVVKQTLSVYRVGSAGKTQRLFRTDGLAKIGSFAIDADELLIAGDYFQGGLDDYANPELARYRRDGTLVWRQSTLHANEGKQAKNAPPGAFGLDTLLAVDHQGRAVTVSLSMPQFAAAQVGRDGNVRWLFSWSWTDDDQIRPYRLTIDDRDRPVIGAGTQTTRYQEQDNRPSGLVADVAGRYREEHWDPYVLGLDHDAENRVLVATREGTREEPHFLIDRIAEDFSTRETFEVPGGGELVAADGGLRGESATGRGGFQGIHVGPTGDVYFWTNDYVGRVALP